VNDPERTLYRSLEYEILEGTDLKGLTLDVGGGLHNSYYEIIRLTGTIYSVNIYNVPHKPDRKEMGFKIDSRA
jgi:hypothetical protein